MHWFDEKSPEFHRIMPPYSHRQEKWLLENPEQQVERFKEADQEFDQYHRLGKEEKASLHHDFNIDKHEREHLPYDKRIDPKVDQKISMSSHEFAIRHLGGKHDLHPVEVHTTAIGQPPHAIERYH